MLDTASLGYLAIDDPVLYDWLGSLTASFNQLQQQVGVDTAPAPQTSAAQALPAPAPPASLAATAARGTFNVTVAPSRGAAPSVQYFLESASDPTFPSSTVVYPLGQALSLSLNLGDATRYFRARAKYPSSNYSPYAYLGTAANPTAVSGGLASSNDILANAPSNAVNNATADSIDAGSSATVRVYGPGGIGSSWTQDYGQGARAFPAGTITGLAYATTYYIAWDTARQMFVAGANLSEVISDSYAFVGKLTTVASGGVGGSSGGGGASFGPGGCTEVGTPLEFPGGATARVKIEPCGDWIEIELESGQRLAMARGTLVSVFRRAEELRPGELVEIGREGSVSAIAKAGRSWRASQKMVVSVRPQGTYWANGIRVHNMKLL
ncbi:MAG TPA: hypothetical protein VNJ52_13600 [Patescibacteria group bacterium]|nr:hypothetical protein [Patescibacteria group bacterium]